MLDVVPPGQNGPRAGAARRAKKLPTPSVVEVDWRLPARLRRPVKAELARQRRRKRQREAIVRFERRPLYASNQSPVTPLRQGFAGQASNQIPRRPQVSAEQHTADVHRAGRPTVAATVPPYAGSFLKRSSGVARPARTLAVRPQPNALAALSGERDIPYQWKQAPTGATATVNIEPPRRRFALPLHLSVWPFRSDEKQAVPASKKKAQNNDWLTL